MLLTLSIKANDSLIKKVRSEDQLNTTESHSNVTNELNVVKIKRNFKIDTTEHTEFLINFKYKHEIYQKDNIEHRKGFYSAVVKHSQNVDNITMYDSISGKNKSIKLNKSVINEMKKALSKNGSRNESHIK